MYVYVYVCIYIYIYIRVISYHNFISIYTYIFKYDVCMYMYVCMWICTYTHIYINIEHISICSLFSLFTIIHYIYYISISMPTHINVKEKTSACQCKKKGGHRIMEPFYNST